MSKNSSAMKRHRQSLKRRLANRSQRSTIRTFTKKAIVAAEAGDFEAAAKYQKVVQSLSDRAANTPVLHKNSAARANSRLNARIKKLREAAEASA